MSLLRAMGNANRTSDEERREEARSDREAEYKRKIAVLEAERDRLTVRVSELELKLQKSGVQS